MRLVLFDIDGTLIRGPGSGRLALERAFTDVFGLPAVPSVEGQVTFNGALDPDIIREVAALLGIDQKRLVAARRELHQRYVDHLGEVLREGPSSTVLPGVRPLLARLEERADFATGLLTGNIEPGAREKLRPHGLNRFFPAGGFGGDGATREDVARVAWHRMQRLVERQIAAKSVWVVGDSLRDVECGRANGFRTAAVATGWTSRETLRAAGPDLLLDDLVGTAALLRQFEAGGRLCQDNGQPGE